MKFSSLDIYYYEVCHLLEGSGIVVLRTITDKAKGEDFTPERCADGFRVAFQLFGGIAGK